MILSIPYGHSRCTAEAAFSSSETLTPRKPDSSPVSSAQQIRDALASPIGSIPLRELAAGKHSAVILISDHTRPVPSRWILPPMLQALREGSPDIRITLLVATGCHRGTTDEELKAKLGDEIFHSEHIVIHDCDDSENMVNLGTLPSGAAVRVNRIAAETELLLAEGFIEPHFFAGFSGGRKSVLPGVCSRQTVLGNHCVQLIDHPCSRAGILDGNPIHADMEAAARLAGLRFIVNVLLDEEKQVVHAVAGDPIAAHREGCRIMGQLAGVHCSRPGDIVITSNGGAPLDQNVYQVVKSLSTAEAAAAPGADIIVCAQCADGIGGEQFYCAMKSCASPSALLRQIRSVPAEETLPDQWQYQILCRILEKHRVLFVTDPSLRQAITDMKMTWCHSLEEAVSLALQAHPNGHAVIIPDGVGAMCI